MYRRMLVLLDGSQPSEVVFNYAQQLAGRLNLDLDLLHVCTEQESDILPMRRAYMEYMAQKLRAGAEEISSSAGGTTPGHAINSRASVVVGQAAEEIRKYLSQNRVDLVMLSTHGRSGHDGFALGRVANQVVHTSPVPVWLVPTELREQVVTDSLPKRNIVIPLNGSSLSEAVLPHAITIATRRGAEAELVLLYVHDVRNLPAKYTGRDEHDVLAKMEEYLEGLAMTVRESGFAARPVILHGDAAPTIIRYLQENPTQLVAMATRGEVGMSPMIFGSVPQHVLQLIKRTPMLMVSGSSRGMSTT